MPRPGGIALLLARIGTFTAQRFADRVADLGLTPEHVAVLRVVGLNPGLTQQDLAFRLGATPSRIVHLVDELEQEGLVERRRNPLDRRHRQLHTVPAAEGRLVGILNTVGLHDADITRGLSHAEKATLYDLLGKIAAEHGIEEDWHPVDRARRGVPGGGR